jgi:HSP20 family molecular chaperone IbpA
MTNETDGECCRPHFGFKSQSHCGPFAGHGPWDFQGMWKQWENFMPYELEEGKDEYIVTMPMPGFDAKDLEVSVKGETILIEAKKTENISSEPSKETESTKKIISMGRFLWDRPYIKVTIPVHEEIDPEQVKAKLLKGILTIRFKKIPSTKIEVKE